MTERALIFEQLAKMNTLLELVANLLIAVAVLLGCFLILSIWKFFAGEQIELTGEKEEFQRMFDNTPFDHEKAS